MSSISSSVVSMLYNVQLMKYAGENGIAAYGVLMYVSMIFQAIFIGLISAQKIKPSLKACSEKAAE